jgi:uncharacterized membrane protein YqjE
MFLRPPNNPVNFALQTLYLARRVEGLGEAIGEIKEELRAIETQLEEEKLSLVELVVLVVLVVLFYRILNHLVKLLHSLIEVIFKSSTRWSKFRKLKSKMQVS